ncbi:MAG: hypothetical protein IJF88_05845 [Oscillospiraceae bacterium]|nr:hypothetical protein [Oscillospiraceae bacterium]
MSNLQIIQALSEIVDKQNKIIRAQAESLHQLGALCMEEETVAVMDEYDRLLGNKGENHATNYVLVI